VKTVTHEQVTMEELGGAMTHNAKSGVAHFAVADDRECLALIRELLGYIPIIMWTLRLAGRTPIRADREDEALDRVIPAQANQPYDMLDIIHSVADGGEFLEVHQHYARNIIVGFAQARWTSGRRGGRTNPRIWPGTLDIDASVKGAPVRPVLRRVQHPARHV